MSSTKLLAKSSEISSAFDSLVLAESQLNVICVFQVNEVGVAVVMKVKTKEERRIRPLALNTVSLLKAASSNLGLGPSRALEVRRVDLSCSYCSIPFSKI